MIRPIKIRSNASLASVAKNTRDQADYIDRIATKYHKSCGGGMLPSYGPELERWCGMKAQAKDLRKVADSLDRLLDRR